MKKIFKYLLVGMFCLLSITQTKTIELNAATPEDYNHWFTDKEPAKDYAYSFAFIGDTQSLSEYNKEHMHTLYQWIVDNKEEKKIEFVFGLGDITEGDADWEWENDKAAISLMDGVVPYSLIRGNHDTTVKFYNTFGNDTYMNQFLGFYKENNINSSYRTLKVGNTNFLLLTMDYGADDAELIWAGNVIERYPDHKVIISTHAYLNRDATTLDANDAVVPTKANDDDKSNKDYNNGEEIWNKLVSQYGNIVLVLSGHIDVDNIPVLQSEGIHGNTVTQMLINPQDMDKVLRDQEGAGMICMAYFDENFTRMEIEYYSPIKKAYYRPENQFTLDISGWGNLAHNLTTKHNDDFHWQECDCGKKMVENLSEHSFEFGCSSKCVDCDFTRETTHKFTKTASKEEGHYSICSECKEVDLSSIRAHVYDDDCDKSCNMCGYIRTVEHSKNSSYSYDVDSHWNACDDCHNELNKAAHIFDDDCDIDCNECGYVRYTAHDYSIIKNEGNSYWRECSICGDRKDIINVKKKVKKSTIIITVSAVGGGLLAAGMTLLIIMLKKKRKLAGK